MKHNKNSWLVFISWAYIAIVISWFFAYLGFGDRFGLLAVINMAAVYLFFPLPLLIILTIFLRNKQLWAGITALALVFIWLWGGLFIPKQRSAHAYPAGNGYLSVMTYNLLGWQFNTAVQIEIIRKEDTDVVMLQELNPEMAQALQNGLADIYPYQIIDPQNDVSGMGILSRYPLSSTSRSLEAEKWVGTPQVIEMAWQGKQVTLINIHMLPTVNMLPSNVEDTSTLQQAQAQVVVDFARGKDAVIVCGDTNITPLSDTYKIFTSVLHESWQEAGFGLGHTFPGSNIPGSSRPEVFGVPFPQWLVRIDYIFHSNRWQTLSARMAQFDGVSDHRGVVAVLDWIE